MPESVKEIIESQKQNCIFCKIVSKEIPSKIVHEDDHVLAILDINPANEGHVLILPKKHYPLMPMVPENELGHFFLIAKKMSLSILKGLSVQGTTTFIANGAVAGQKAPHFMIHVIPRNERDGLFKIPKNHFESDQLLKLQKRISGRLNATSSSEESEKPSKPQPKEDGSEKDVSLDDIAGLFTK